MNHPGRAVNLSVGVEPDTFAAKICGRSNLSEVVGCLLEVSNDPEEWALDFDILLACGNRQGERYLGRSWGGCWYYCGRWGGLWGG